MLGIQKTQWFINKKLFYYKTWKLKLNYKIKQTKNILLNWNKKTIRLNKLKRKKTFRYNPLRYIWRIWLTGDRLMWYSINSNAQCNVIRNTTFRKPSKFLKKCNYLFNSSENTELENKTLIELNPTFFFKID